MKREALFFIVFPAIALSLISVSPLTRTHAATFTVNSTSDNADANVGDGICADLLGNCTLRAAIQEANVNANLDIIEFNLAGAGVKTISVSPLPAISQPISALLIVDRDEGFDFENAAARLRV